MEKFFTRQRQENYFSVRVKSAAGKFSAEQLAKIREASEIFGAGFVHITSRQEISIPFISSEKLSEVEEFFNAAEIKFVAIGAKVKTVTACQGNQICSAGKIDAAKIANELEKIHGGRKLPHKLTIAVAGCENNCWKVEGNDIGIKGGEGFQIYFCGENFLPIIFYEAELYKIISAAINFFDEHGKPRERFKNFIERTEFKKQLRLAID